jgi:hypothetical protein
MEKRSIGLQSLKIGDVDATGGMGTTLAALGVTLADSAELVQEDGATTDINSEENDDPEEIIEEKGKTTLKFSIIDYTPATLEKVLGGTVTGVGEASVWSAPSSLEVIEKSIEIISKSNVKYEIVRARIKAKINAKFSKKGVAQIDIVATVMTPTLSTAKSLSISKVVA